MSASVSFSTCHASWSPLPSTRSANYDTRTLPVAADAKKDDWQIAVDKLQEQDSSVADQIEGVQRATAAASNADLAVQVSSLNIYSISIYNPASAFSAFSSCLLSPHIFLNFDCVASNAIGESNSQSTP
jgi:hypothetical protein